MFYSIYRIITYVYSLLNTMHRCRPKRTVDAICNGLQGTSKVSTGISSVSLFNPYNLHLFTIVHIQFGGIKSPQLGIL